MIDCVLLNVTLEKLCINNGDVKMADRKLQDLNSDVSVKLRRARPDTRLSPKNSDELVGVLRRQPIVWLNDLGFYGLIRTTVPFSHFLRQWRGAEDHCYGYLYPKMTTQTLSVGSPNENHLPKTYMYIYLCT